MTITDFLLPEYDHEMGCTRRLLERMPEAAFTWKPHGKSMTLAELGGHLAGLAAWVNVVLTSTSFDIDSVARDPAPRPPEALRALLATFDRNVAAARAAIAAKTDAELLAPWTLRSGTQEIFTMPRLGAIRSFVVSHTIHHRGQLSVYLRLQDVPLPSIYGPTADEP